MPATDVDFLAEARKDKCPLCGGRAIVNMDGLVVGYFHLVNCEVMLKLRGENGKSTRSTWKHGNTKDVRN